MSTEATGTPSPVATAAAPAANPAPAPAPSSDPTLDTRLAALSKREREIQQQIASFKQEKQNMVPKTELASLWKSDRSKLRELLGASPDELPDFVEKGTATKDDPIKALKDELEGIKRQKQEEDQAKAVKEIKSQISSFITQDKDAYELVNAFEATDMVFDLMVDHYREHNEELDYKTAADQVENYLFDQFKRGAGAKKISSLFQTASESQKKEPSPTLTGSAVSSPVSGLQRKLTPEESVSEAAKLIKWT